VEHRAEYYCLGFRNRSDNLINILCMHASSEKEEEETRYQCGIFVSLTLSSMKSTFLGNDSRNPPTLVIVNSDNLQTSICIYI
jgi:hypothetical protein